MISGYTLGDTIDAGELGLCNVIGERIEAAHVRDVDGSVIGVSYDANSVEMRLLSPLLLEPFWWGKNKTAEIGAGLLMTRLIGEVMDLGALGLALVVGTYGATYKEQYRQGSITLQFMERGVLTPEDSHG